MNHIKVDNAWYILEHLLQNSTIHVTSKLAGGGGEGSVAKWIVLDGKLGGVDLTMKIWTSTRRGRVTFFFIRIMFYKNLISPKFHVN